MSGLRDTYRHPKYGVPRVPDSDPSAVPGADRTWIYAHSLGAPYRDFYAIDNKCRIFSLAKRNFVTPNINGKISFGCGVGRNSEDPHKPQQRVALEVAMRSYFPDFAPPEPTKQFRLGHIDGDHQNNSIFNLHWIAYNRVEAKKEITWPVATPEQKIAALRDVQRMYGGYKETLHAAPKNTVAPRKVRHSVEEYGEFFTGWRKVIWPGLEDGLYYTNEMCEIFSTRIGRPVQPTEFGQVVLSNTSNDTNFKLLARTVALRSFYPQKYAEVVAENTGIEQRDVTVDHVNGMHSDNRIENMQFLTRGENSRKGSVAPFFHAPQEPQESHENEVWKSSDVLQKKFPGYQASTLGRIRLPSGRITRGTKISTAPKYRILLTEYGRVLIHRLVFMAFSNTEIPEGFCVSHRKGSCLDADGTHCSYPQDLSLLRRNKRKLSAAADAGGGEEENSEPDGENE